MTVRRRRLLIVTTLALLATASLLAVAAYIQRLPDPTTADRRGLFRWLVECDVKDEPLDVQLSLMRRTEQELTAGIDFRDVMSLLDSDQRRRLVDNADQLARCWFRQAAGAYFATPQGQRTAVLGQQLDTVRRLGIMDQLSAIDRWAQEPAGSRKRLSQEQTEGPEKACKRLEAAGSETLLAASSPEMAAAQIARIQRWVDEATPQDRPRLSQYFAALRDRMIAESMQQLGSLGNLLLGR